MSNKINKLIQVCQVSDDIFQHDTLVIFKISLDKSEVLFPHTKPLFVTLDSCFNNEVVTIWSKSKN